MKTVKLTKQEMLMLLDAIGEWELGTYANSDSGEGSGYSPSKLKAMDSAKQVLQDILNS
jgi:hypothetical protein